MDKQSPAREQLQQLLVLFLELLKQDVAELAGSHPPAFPRHIDDIELAEAATPERQAGPNPAALPTDLPEQVDMHHFDRHWRRK